MAFGSFYSRSKCTTVDSISGKRRIVFSVSVNLLVILASLMLEAGREHLIGGGLAKRVWNQSHPSSNVLLYSA